MLHTDYTTPLNNIDSPGPRNPDPPALTDADLADLAGHIAALDILSRRQAARDARRSSFWRLRGGR